MGQNIEIYIHVYILIMREYCVSNEDTREHRCKVFQQRSSINTHKVTHSCNGLPEMIANGPRIDCFKFKLSKYWKQ